MTITIHKQELLYDINALIFKAADIVDPQQVNTYHLRPDESELDQGIIARLLNRRDSSMRILLQRYLHSENITESNDVLDMLKTSYVYSLDMPDNWPAKLLNPLTQNIHDYLVNGTIFDYYLNNIPDMAQRIDVDSYSTSVKSIINMRTGCVKRPLRPF